MKIKSNQIVKNYSGKFVSGEFTKLDGTQRKFHGQLRTNTRSTDQIVFWDLTKKAMRSISLQSDHIIIRCGRSTFEIGEVA